MLSSTRRTALAFAVAASSVALAREARADDKQACVAASEKAQQLRNAGRLTEARDQLVACSRNECPKLVQSDCTQWMRDVLDVIPSVVPAAKDRRGRDILDVKVMIDGRVATESLDGKPISLDPGAHTLRFETKGAPPVEEPMLVRQGERNRLVTAMFAIGDETKATGEAVGGSAGGAGKSAGGERRLPIPAMIVGGIGLVGGGVALYLGLSADADGRDLRDTCAPRCADSQVQDVKDKQALARILAVASGAVVAAGVVLLVIHYAAGGKASGAVRPGWTIAPAPGGDATILRF